MDVSLQLAKCLVEKDSRMPRFKVSGELPLLHLKISDQKVQQVLDLVHSIPLPNIGSSPSTPTEKVLSLARPAAPLLPPALLGAVETDSDEDASDQSDEGVQRPAAEELPEIHFLFEVKEVLVELTRQHQVSPVLSLRVSQLGAEGRRRSFDLSVTAYLRRVALDYCDGTGGRSRPLHLISCSEQQDSHLLKVEFIKADPNGPSFQTVFNSTEQTLKVEFSSLDFLLHTSALLDTISYLSRAAPPRSSATRRVERAGPDRTGPKAVKDGGVFSFKLLAVLGCFHVQVCDGGGSIADIRVQGLEASVAVQVKETQVFARLRDIVVTDVDPGTVHGKVVSIVGEEVFSLQLSLFPGATEGRGYSDTSQVDGKLTLRLGCIQIVYLHRFMMSLLTFVDNFQAAKEALGAATAQAASGVRGLAQRSVRLAVDVRLKAPLVIIPRSSSSHDALVMDLGLITVGNGFSLLPADGFSLPAVTEKMEVKLTQLKICRTRLQSDAPQHAILQPLDVELLVTRNLSASWFRRAPGVQVQGVLRALKVSLGQEDLAVLLDILLGNIGEGGQERRAHAGRRAREEAELAERQEAAPPRGDGAPAAAAGDVEENTVNVLLDFEIKEVLLTLKKPKGQEEAPFLVFHAAHLGTNAKVRRYDTCATTFIKKISVRCLEFKDAAGEPLSLVSSSVEPGAELLRVQYLKADRAGPGFSSVYNNTEQMINVTFTSLDLVLHTEALLSAISFVSAALPPGRVSSEERGSGPRAEEEESSPMSGVSPRLRPSGRSWQEVNSASCFPPAAPASPAGSEVIELKVVMTLGAFGVLLCDRSCNMADIKIQGVHGALLVQGTHTQVSARLRDFIVLNADPHSVHRKAVSIVGDEVFSFNVSLTPNATEGAGYSDTSRTDGSVRLSVGCIQVVYLHKFIMSLLNFTDHFQAAKEALGAATAQAAEKAASGVRGLAQKSFRLAVDVRLQAPIIIIPRSSTSHDALVMDLGLITVGNSFSLLPVDGCPLPAVVDNMDVELTQLKLSRGCTDPEARRPPTELLQPLNLHLNLKRNLAASWHKDMVPVEITGDLKPMKVELSQDDLTMLLRILMENLGEASSLEASAPRAEAGLQGPAAGGPRAGAVGPVGCEEEEEEETLRFTFNIESLGLVLYSNDPQQPSPPTRQQHLRLGGLAFHRLRASGSLQSGGGVALSAALSSCTLDDLRSGVQRVTSRMVGRRDRASAEPMVDLSYRQSAGRREAAAVLQAPYLCASVEFLMAVADFFLKALPPRPAPSAPLRPTAGPRPEAQTGPRVRTRLRLVVLDPEVVFVASLMQADAPSLVASFQCDFSLQAEEDGTQSARAHLRELKVLACPFIRSREDEAVTTVLRPCSVALEARTHPDRPLSGSVVVEEVIVKISPFILNAVQSITAAMTAEQSGEQSREAEADLGDLWSAMNLYSCNYWFLGVDRAPEATESLGEPGGRQEGQSFTAEVKVVQVTLESGLGHRTVPLLLAESSFSGSATNWSSLLQLRANMTLEVNYFNELQAVWEPLIERVDSGRRRWTLELEMKNNPVQDQSSVHGDDFVFLPEPRTFISVSSKDTLNITVSQSSLQVFHHLAQAFSGSRASSCAYSLKEKAPFSIRNCLGVPLFLQLSPSLRPAGPPAGPPAQGTLLQLPEDGSLDLEFCSSPASHGKLSALQRQESGLFHLTMVPSGYSEVADVSLDWPGRRLYAARGAVRRESVSVLLQVDVVEGNKVVTVRSPLQIQNHFSVAFAVLRYCAASGGLESVGQAEPERELHIDLESYRSQLFVRPAGSLEGRYGASTSCLAWKEQVHRSQEVRSVLQCPAADAGLLPLAVVSLAVPDELRHIGSHGGRDWDPAYVIHLHPLAALRNLLPYTVRYMMECSADSVELPEGGSADLLTARLCGELLSLVLVRYQGRDWQGHVRLEAELPEFFPVRLVCDSDAGAALDLSVHATRAAGRLLLSLFSPYWLVNRTGRVLRYRGEDAGLKQPADARHAVLFSFRRKNRFSKSQLQLCVSTSSWSDGFSLDTVGSYGCVRCPADGKDFLVGVAIRLSSSSLTRVVTFSPFFTLVNRSSYELEVGEVTGPAATRWHYVSSSECLPLWPDDIAGKLCVRVVGSESTSKFFFFNRQDNGTLLSLAQCGGLIVDVNMSDVSTAVGFSDYYEGAAPALLLNHTPWVSIGYRQSGSAAARELKPGEARRFLWDDPAGVRKLSWSCEEHGGELDLLKDGVGQFSSGSLAQVHWVSFLDGRQRVLLFTEDVAVVTKARQAEELEQFQQEVKVSLQSLGLSLVNNANRQEIAYIGITSSGVVWEMKPRSRWKPLSQKSINQLEKTFQGQQAGWVRLEGNLEVNLDAAVMAMRRPFCSPLRRNFLSGVQVEFKQSPHQRSLRAQVHWLQVDNQLPGAIFPIVFHPVPPPKSIALDSEPKPFIDVSVITRFNRHSSVMQFKYFMALVQEMAVKIDQGFLGATLALFSPAADPQADKQKEQLLDGDLQLLQAELMEASLSDQSGLSFFEHFHISPIKLHLSLSLGSSGDDSSQETAALQSFNLLLKSIGATLTDVDDLIFKLAFFEVKYQFYRREKLMWAVVRHYSEQFLKQMYVLVLGLDVLGNPFGLIRGLSEGVEAFFYEPFQGAVQGPEEFAEGFVIGVRSLLGHTVGGAAGMVSRITGSVGKGLAAITMDKEYQQKRREEMNRPPRDFGQSLAKGGKGLLKGVLGGVTGIVTKPVEGAKKEGALGFFKGIGKGLVGVVARPTGGIVDMASSTFQGIQRAVESSQEVTQLRPVRLIQEDGVIRPYDLTESQGLDLFQRSGLQQLDGEVFRAHLQYPGHRKTTIIVTNRRVLCVKEIDFVGHFSREWECLFENFSRPPTVTGSQLRLYCKEQQMLKLSQDSVRNLELRDPNSAQKLHAALSEAQAAQQQRRMASQKSRRFLEVQNQQ